LLTISIYRYIQSKIYDFLSTLSDMNGYVSRLKEKTRMSSKVVKQ